MEHHSPLRLMDAAQGVPSPGRHHGHAACQESSEQHMRPANSDDWAGCNGPPISGDDPSVDYGVTDRNLHPAVVTKYPERREHGPQGDHAARNEVKPGRYPFASKQHDAEESGFQHKGRKSLIAEKRALDGAHPLG